MSFLAPLYILGLAAVAAPFILHLIRRSPKGEVPFSSLMFLSPTPPRLTRRSRLDHWLLLLLRIAALGILAFAFARPFLRQAAQLSLGDDEPRRVALVIDTSASMRRGDLWPRAQVLATQVLGECRPTDQLGVFAFDTTFQTLLRFDDQPATVDGGQRQAVARRQIADLKPGWRGTDLGQALVSAVAAVEDLSDKSEKAGRMPRRVILIGDIAHGSRTDALGDFEWPADVDLEIKTVGDTGSNAGLERLADPTEAEAGESDTARRVRVFNNPGSDRQKFELTWVDEQGVAAGKPIDVYVPPGESRVVRVPRPPVSLPRPSLKLTGDSKTQTFDNIIYFADEPPRELTVFYIGADRADDHQGLLYYLERVFADRPRQSVRVVSRSPSKALEWDGNHLPQLVVVTAESPANVSGLREYLHKGGTILYVATAPGPAQTLAALAEVPAWDVKEANVASDVMLREIDFGHPLFAALAGPQFNDFTKIRFMKYRRLGGEHLGEPRVLARFETGDAAIIEKRLHKGTLVVMASGWQPADSQLARSSKFVPLLSSLMELGNRRPVVASIAKVGDRVPLPAAVDSASSVVVRKPDGASATVAPQTAYFDGTDLPGVYTIETPGGASSFAVNLDPLESKTAPIDRETIERYKVRLAKDSRQKIDDEQLRQMYSGELEGRQKLWRWLILAVIGILILETWLAGRTSNRSRSVRAETVTS